MENYRSIAVLVLLVVLIQNLASGLQVEKEYFTTSRPYFADDAGSPDRGGFMPVVNVDRQNNRSKVDVHVPLFFQMTNDKGVDAQKLDLSVLGGLVTVNRDRARQPNGASTGPTTVTVFGIPVYSGFGGRTLLQRISDSIGVERKVRSGDLHASGPGDLETAASETDVTTMLPSMKKVKDFGMQTLNDGFAKISNFVTRASPIENTNGRPANPSDGFVAPSKFLKSDFEPRVLNEKKNVTEKLVAHA